MVGADFMEVTGTIGIGDGTILTGGGMSGLETLISMVPGEGLALGEDLAYGDYLTMEISTDIHIMVDLRMVTHMHTETALTPTPTVVEVITTEVT